MSADEEFAEILVRYHREYDRYLKLATRVADICREEIVEANAIRAQVTYRVKSKSSLIGKLRRMASKEPLVPIAEAVLDSVIDLAAVRISVYEASSVERVVQEVEKRFGGPLFEPIKGESKDKHKSDQNNFYCATHFSAYLRLEDLIGTYRNLGGAPCEIQVCTMMAHVWNEIEHDLAYKPMSGELSRAERELLNALGHLTRSGDGIITRLLEATNARQSLLTGQFEDVYDFVARLRTWFPGVDFANYAGQLFEELRSLGITTPKQIEDLIGGKTGMVERAAKALEGFNESLKRRSEFRYMLDLDSSDLLLVLLLPTQAGKITQNHPTGRGVGGPPRIAWLAARYEPGRTGEPQ